MEHLFIVIAVATTLAFLALLIAGKMNKVVIYFSAKDLAISFMPWVLVLLGFIAPEIVPQALAGHEAYVLYACFALSAVFVIWAVKLSIYYNKSPVLGAIVVLFKVVFALLTVLVLVGQMGKVFSQESGGKDKIIALLIFGIFIWLGKKLINGREVYIAKGWELPEQ